MSIWSILGGWASRRNEEIDVGTDADSLAEIWGETAYDVAANLAWREDAGLLRSSSPGHWGRVQEEIGRRISPAMRPQSRKVAMPHVEATGSSYRSPSLGVSGIH